jgi:hypothetical protein
VGLSFLECKRGSLGQIKAKIPVASHSGLTKDFPQDPEDSKLSVSIRECSERKRKRKG